MQRIALLIFWTALCGAFTIASLPIHEPISGSHNDKLQHVIAFTVLGVLAPLAYPRTSLLLLFIGLVSFGALIELVQGVTNLGRVSDLGDWVADAVAVAVVLSCFSFCRSRRYDKQ